MNTTQPYVPRIGERMASSERFQSSKRAELKIWWREIDRVLLFLILLLMAFGTAAVAAASPASARRLSTIDVTLPDLYFYWAHLKWQFLGIVTLIGASMLSRDNARRLGVLVAAGALFLLILVPVLGYEVNGAKRWINLGMRFQPSEFLKPGFAVALAWILSWRLRDPNLPVLAIVSGLMGFVGVLLMLQPNLGATLLFGGVWFVLVLLSGVSIQRIGALIGAGVAAFTATYFLYDNARNRIDAFLGGGTAFDQVDLAQRTLLAGGWTGSGLWLGVRKLNLPEAHTDYIFSVIGEEFGLIVCALVVILYLAIIARVLVRLADEENLFALLAGAGLVTQIVGQAFINILVNLQLFPSKGMTLPLVSYGGSSTIAVCLTVGLLLAITRRNPFLTRETPGLRKILPVKETRT
ncbi:putative peptidoglycan glycosyltransferase FtsW [Pontixanthobacter aestiaquae]|uniref:Probable peptidoglycan glycosyltransferase FtsW n=1 Tax=Pontixanthobacter aestiaquae TaxID=1509367 RepID=A0A844Z5E9_9SPHN|nr:putative peptidoglycan glycosyltransferase FtsW [Pontixanthobacter aestiaquae]MDN3646019.1 putative peptidoglycan glycosyltransferase FtsW [Pontixanthobacter aestiaquae]MXO82988.1 cell division protein FtsW [Pontixanthobacter aestiaquae]